MSIRLKRALALGGAITAIIGALASNAFAAEEIETVVVTSEKRTEDIQKIPAAITAVSGSELKRQSIQQVLDLPRIVPSLTMVQSQDSATGPRFDIRGQVASDIILNISQAVGLYEDGVNIPHPEGTSAAFFDLDRVEVLRGPQGTLYGRNTTGGAVNIITKGADFDGLSGYGEAEGGNYSDWKIGGAINVPIIDNELAVRVAYQHWNRNGFGSSVTTGQRLGGAKDQDIARVSVLFTPRSDVTVDLRTEYINIQQNGDLVTARAYVPNGSSLLEAGLESGAALVPDSNAPAGCYPFTCGSVTSTVAAGTAAIATDLAKNNLFHNTSQTNQFEHDKVWHADANITWDISPQVHFKSITGYHQFSDNHVEDLDVSKFQLVEFGAGGTQLQPIVGHIPFGKPTEEADRFISQEFDVLGTLFGDRVNWLLGAFYGDDSGHGNQPTVIDPLLTALTSTLIAFPSGYSPEVVFAYDQKSVTDRSWAIFSQNDIKIFDNVTATIGGRYTTDDLGQNIATFVYDASPYGAGGTPPPPAAPGSIPTAPDPLAGLYICPVSGAVGPTTATCDFHQKASFSGYSYLLSLNWQITDDVMAYAKTSEGYRSGALQARAAGLPAAKPETAHDWEIGLKTSFFNHRLQANLDAYETLYANKQETQVVVINGINSTPILNAASAKIKGFEAEANAIPIDGLRLGGSLTYFDGKYEKFLTALTPQNTIINASGFPFLEPKWHLNVSGRYDMTVGDGDLGIEADWAWTSAIPITPLQQNTGVPALGGLVKELSRSVGILNARIDYSLTDTGWNVALFSTNLLDKHYQQFGFDQSLGQGFAVGITQEPRMFGIQIRKSFGG